jgi:hypothetical protein
LLLGDEINSDYISIKIGFFGSQFVLENSHYIYRMKKFYHLTFTLGTAGMLFFAGIESDNGKAGATGSPGEQTCSQSNCHTGSANNSMGGSVALTSSDLVNWEYTPGQTYTLTATVTQQGRTLFGVGLEALLPSGANAGTLTPGVGTTIKTATVMGNSRNNIVHNSNAGATANAHSFTFTWTAPATDIGPITMYFAGNATNNNGAKTGDYIYNASQIVTPAGVGISEQENSPLTFSFYPNPTTENITVNYSLEESAKVQYVIYDLTGKKVQTEAATRFPGAQQQSIDVISLQAGTYLLSLNVNGSVITKRFVKK